MTIVLSVSIVAMYTTSVFAQETTAPAKVVAPTATPASATPVRVTAPVTEATPVTEAAPVSVATPATSVTPYTTSTAYKTGSAYTGTSVGHRPRIGFGFDGIPLNGSHREATRMRRAYRGTH